jgi:hypothetical protein
LEGDKFNFGEIFFFLTGRSLFLIKDFGEIWGEKRSLFFLSLFLVKFLVKFIFW